MEMQKILEWLLANWDTVSAIIVALISMLLGRANHSALGAVINGVETGNSHATKLNIAQKHKALGKAASWLLKRRVKKLTEKK